MIEASGLSVLIAGRTIVKAVDLAANAGEVTVVVGPNGSGKSTLLKALSGDLPYAGSATLNGREIASMPPVEQAMHRAVLPQATTLSFPFTVHEIVQLGVLAGVSTAQAGSRLVGQALALVELEGFSGRLYQELSGGEQQRVQLARVLCQVWKPTREGSPRWLLLDEPVSSLDIRHQLTILDVARNYAKAGGGVIAVLHDLNLAAMAGDRIVAMRDGTIIAAGAPADVVVGSVIEKVFDCRVNVGATPPPGTPFVLPQLASTSRLS